MNTIELQIAELIKNNTPQIAAKIMYDIMKDCVAAEVVTTGANMYRVISALVEAAAA